MTSSDIRNDIMTCNKSFMEAFARGDAAGLAALYTAGGQLLPPNSDVVSGRDAIRAFWQGAIDMGLKEARLDTMEAEGVGNTGKYVVIWKTEAGGWKLHRDIWNSSRPAPK
jgi:ketosteroid isomerase-like protein